MQSTTLLLIRHAEHADFGRRLTGRAEGVPLTAEGVRQAEALARGLAWEGVSSVLTSPAERAVATAGIIAATCQAPLTVEPALHEIDFGAWTSAPFAELAADPLWAEWNARRGAARPPGGESMAEAVARMEMLVARLGDAGQVALVSHADMIRGFVASCLGLPFDGLLRFEIGPASVSRVELGPDGPRVLSLNEGARRT